MTENVHPTTYARIFEQDTGGADVLTELVETFCKPAFVSGGADGERETCRRLGQREVVDFILTKINQTRT